MAAVAANPMATTPRTLSQATCARYGDAREPDALSPSEASSHSDLTTVFPMLTTGAVVAALRISLRLSGPRPYAHLVPQRVLGERLIDLEVPTHGAIEPKVPSR